MYLERTKLLTNHTFIFNNGLSIQTYHHNCSNMMDKYYDTYLEYKISKVHKYKTDNGLFIFGIQNAFSFSNSLSAENIKW